jgi:sirohydrochlorin cobaltochelatase
MAQLSDHHHGLRGVPHTHAHPHPHPHGQSHEQALETLLPPRYQHGQEASPIPMAAAPLKYNSAGQVAWDEIWADFCDLALAGGPPHRGELLEPVLPGAVAANPQGYEWVLAELERGFRLVTGLPVVRSQSPGWIGLECDSEQMALWLLRAIVIENVSVRREGKTLFLPAGPDFRLEDEIKNVITVVAKTHHYWSEHIMAVNG